jgi:hypothetical protein
MRCDAWIVMAALVGVASCGDNIKLHADDARPDTPAALAHCLDSPSTIVMPPSGRLPCDLLPPGFGQ